MSSDNRTPAQKFADHVVEYSHPSTWVEKRDANAALASMADQPTYAEQLASDVALIDQAFGDQP